MACNLVCMTARTRIHDDPIELWRSVAQLSPRVLPSPGASSRSITVKDYLSGHHMPWEPGTGHSSSARDRSWHHTVFAGLVRYRRLLEYAGFAPVETRGRTELTALFAAAVSEDGQLLPNSLELSRTAWAAAVAAGAEAGTANLPETYAEAARAWRDGLIRTWTEHGVRMRGIRANGPHEETPRSVPDETGRRRPDRPRRRMLERSDLVTAVRYTRDFLGLPDVFPDRAKNLPVRIRSILGPPPSAAGDVSQLNHPAAKDLDLATETTRFRQAAAGLLGVDAAEPFERVQDSREALYYAVAPRMVPEGTFHLSRPSVSTQFAINASLNELGESEGLWTCPRSTAAGAPEPEWTDDVVAGLVTRRAVAMARIPDPAELFDPEALSWSSGRHLFALHPDLTGFEFVRSSPLRATSESEAGSSVHVRILPGMTAQSPYQGFADGQTVDAVRAIDMVLNTLNHASPTMGPEDYETWDETARTVLQNVERVKSLLAERQRFHEVVPMLLRNEHVVTDIAEALAESTSGIEEKEEELAGLSRSHQAARAKSMEYSDAIAAHLRDEPRMIARLATFGRNRIPWRERLGQLRRDQSLAQADEESAQARVDRVHRELRQLRAAHEALRDDLRDNKESVRSLREELASYPYPDHAIDQEWLAGDWQEEGAPAPWLDGQIQKARYDAFQAALHMHSMAIQGLPEEFRTGLLAARDLLNGRPCPDPSAVLSAWQVLGLVFPQLGVASEHLPGVCRSLGEHRLGWIVYADADRLRPGVAYAGLLHAHRAILMAGHQDHAEGSFENPPPYTAPPEGVQLSLARAHSCSEGWSPARTSAYGLAVATSRYSG